MNKRLFQEKEGGTENGRERDRKIEGLYAIFWWIQVKLVLNVI